MTLTLVKQRGLEVIFLASDAAKILGCDVARFGKEDGNSSTI
jgi:hypothetical protein